MINNERYSEADKNLLVKMVSERDSSESILAVCKRAIETIPSFKSSTLEAVQATYWSWHNKLKRKSTSTLPKSRPSRKSVVGPLKMAIDEIEGRAPSLEAAPNQDPSKKQLAARALTLLERTMDLIDEI